MLKKILLLTLSVVLTNHTLSAFLLQASPEDTLNLSCKKPGTLIKCFVPSAPFLLSGVMLVNKGNSFQLLRNEYVPSFRTSADDFTMFVPSLMIFGLKAAGVKTQSSWRSLSLNYIISASIMGTITLGLKNSVSSKRPDFTNNKSFASGHSAFSFMGAQIVSREYGKDHPWISIGAYGFATATALMRVLNNKHYFQDVLMGAGIGILSAEAGYATGRLILKEGRKGKPDYWIEEDKFSKPLLKFSMVTGFNNVLNKVQSGKYTTLKVKQGVTFGAETAYNVSERFSAILSGHLNSAPTVIERAQFSITGPVLSWQSVVFQPEFSYDVHRNGSLAIRAGGGYAGVSQRDSYNYSILSLSGLSLNAGINYTYRPDSQLQYRLFTSFEEIFLKSDTKSLTSLSYGAAISMCIGKR